MRTLKPIYDHDRYSDPIAKAIYATLYKEIFQPLFDIFDIPPYRENAASKPLIDALRSGRIRYEDGVFSGSLTAAISKELRGLGAVYNKQRKAYTLGHASLPQDIKLAIQAGNELARSQVDKAQKFLSAIEGRKISAPDITPMFGDVVASLDKQFHATTKKVTSSDVEVPLEPALGDALKGGYTENLDKYIQGWHDEQVLRLRYKIQQGVAKGYRSEEMIDTIKSERHISFNKAKFLARQETSLMVSKYRQIRYEAVGLNKYIWSTSHDRRVRHDHKALDGKVFDFNNPPVTDVHTMARNNPGEDFNCRCVAIPVLSNREVLERDMYKEEVAAHV